MVEAKQNKRKSIIEAAEKLFAKSGFHGTDVDQIAKTAGVSKGSATHTATAESWASRASHLLA